MSNHNENELFEVENNNHNEEENKMENQEMEMEMELELDGESVEEEMEELVSEKVKQEEERNKKEKGKRGRKKMTDEEKKAAKEKRQTEKKEKVLDLKNQNIIQREIKKGRLSAPCGRIEKMENGDYKLLLSEGIVFAEDANYKEFKETKKMNDGKFLVTQEASDKVGSEKFSAKHENGEDVEHGYVRVELHKPGRSKDVVELFTVSDAKNHVRKLEAIEKKKEEDAKKKAEKAEKEKAEKEKKDQEEQQQEEQQQEQEQN